MVLIAEAFTLKPNITVFPMWVIFMASYFVLANMIFKPNMKILKERDKQTDGLQKDSENFIQQTEIKVREYDALMTDAKNIARTSREDILKVAEQQKNEIIAEARQKSEATLEELRKKIRSEVEGARGQLNTQADQIAEDMTKKLINRAAA